MPELADLLAPAPLHPAISCAPDPDWLHSFDAVGQALDHQGFDRVLARAVAFKRLNPGATYNQFSRALFGEWRR